MSQRSEHCSRSPVRFGTGSRSTMTVTTCTRPRMPVTPNRLTPRCCVRMSTDLSPMTLPIRPARCQASGTIQSGGTSEVSSLLTRRTSVVFTRQRSLASSSVDPGSVHKISHVGTSIA